MPATTLVFHSCQAKKQKIDKQLYGVWNSIGYGQQFKISKKNVLIHDTYENEIINIKQMVNTKPKDLWVKVSIYYA